MAFIQKDQFIKINKSRHTLHKPASASYTVFESNGKKIFQLDTYGSDDRKDKGKLSQTLQIDEESARILVSLLIKEYNLE